MRFSISRLGLMLGLISLCACSSLHKKSGANGHAGDESEATDASSGDEAPPANIAEKEDSSENVELNIEKPYKSSYGEVMLDQNSMVDKWIAYFQGRGRKYMAQYLSRSSRYLPMMKNVLRENGLPEDLVYIALIESGFSPRAHSNANAVGYWQFIRSTGKRFGLHVDTFIDERRDPVMSTRAAAEYFKSLYSLFGSWHLALAAYNVGEMRVKRAVTRHYTRDFWALVKRRRALPAETKQYVPKFIAAVLIARNPEKYGFSDVEYEDPLSYDTVALSNPISLTKLASNLNVEVEELKLLNPKFRTDFVPIERGNETVVRIPVGRGTDAQAALPVSVTNQPKVIAQSESYFYRIRRGDTLSTVARRHHTTVSRLRRLNGLSNRTLLRVGRAIRVPDVGGDGIQVAVEEDTRTPDSVSSRRKGGIAPQMEPSSGDKGGDDGRRVGAAAAMEFHIVRRGENLSTIARRYGTTVGDLRRINSLNNRSVIRRGQRLRVRAAAPSTSAAKPPKPSALRPVVLREYGRASHMQKEIARGRYLAGNGKTLVTSSTGRSSRGRRHTVRRGETLMEVSRKYRVSLSDLARANRLKISHRVMAGERLLIPE